MRNANPMALRKAYVGRRKSGCNLNARSAAMFATIRLRPAPRSSKRYPSFKGCRARTLFDLLAQPLQSPGSQVKLSPCLRIRSSAQPRLVVHRILASSLPCLFSSGERRRWSPYKAREPGQPNTHGRGIVVHDNIFARIRRESCHRCTRRVLNMNERPFPFAPFNHRKLLLANLIRCPAIRRHTRCSAHRRIRIAARRSRSMTPTPAAPAAHTFVHTQR